MTPVEALQKSALFRDFSETGLAIFSAIAKVRAVPAGVPIFSEDEVAESLFIVRSGRLRITRREAGKERTLGVAGPGDHLGGLALLARGVRLVSATAETPCEVVEIAQRDFQWLQPQKPQACLKLALAIAADLSQRLGEEREAVRSMAASRD